MQTCKKCKKEKGLSEFYIQPQTKNGREAICRTCKLARSKRSRERLKAQKNAVTDSRNFPTKGFKAFPK